MSPNHSNGSCRFVNLAGHGFVLEPRYYFYGWSPSSQVIARKSAVDALLRARSSLPRGYNFKIWDAYRPRRVQIAMLKSFERRLRLMCPELSRKKLTDLLYRFGGRPDETVTRFDTHRNGGSFDLTLVDQNDIELQMGTDHDELTPRAELEYFEGTKCLSTAERTAKRNRRLLKRALTRAGFTCYSPEWWHWSYDK